MSTTTAPYSSHLTGPDDLITNQEQTRAAFVAVLVEKGEMAIPVIEQAKALRVAVSCSASPLELLERHDIQPAILTAAGIMDKDLRQLAPDGKQTAILTLIEEFLLPRGEQYADELVFRFLLTKGASLAKRPRQMLGLIANRRFARSVAASLLLRGIPMMVKISNGSSWQSWDAEMHDIPLGLRGLAWSGHDGARTLQFCQRVSLCGRRFDVVLKRFGPSELGTSPGQDKPENYLSLGEIEAELDSQDADGHWTTSHRAILDAHTRFENHGWKPGFFYVGSAIPTNTADAIWGSLQSGLIVNAANSHYDAQLGSVAQWMIQL